MKESERHLFYSDNIDSDNTIYLNEEETRHAVSVLRLKAGQKIRITNGRGVIYDCLCAAILKRSISCDITGRTTVPRITPELTMLVGIPDKEHFETILEHATALCVYRVVPLVMEHCRKPWWELWDRQSERFASKMVASMKQCLYPYIPRLDAPTSLQEVIDTCYTPIIVGDRRAEKSLFDIDLSQYQKLSCLTGPPGGISTKEENLLESRECLSVKIAPARLRTELAATILSSLIIAPATYSIDGFDSLSLKPLVKT